MYCKVTHMFSNGANGTQGCYAQWHAGAFIGICHGRVAGDRKWDSGGSHLGIFQGKGNCAKGKLEREISDAVRVPAACVSSGYKTGQSYALETIDREIAMNGERRPTREWRNIVGALELANSEAQCS